MEREERTSAQTQNGSASHVTLKTGEEENKSGLQRLKRAGKKIYSALSSHVGLVGLLIAYSFMGAAIFQAIEQPAEKKLENHVDDDRVEFLKKLKELIEKGNTVNVTSLEQDLRAYEMNLYSAFQNGFRLDGKGVVWDFWGAFLFCATVYSTVGYGNIAPRTEPGKIATMLYALLGIPLCLVVMASLGRLFTKALKFLWKPIRKRTLRFQHIKANLVAKLMRKRKPSETEGEAAGNSHLDTCDDEADGSPVYVVDENFNLPPLVAIGIVIVYIFSGAALYRLWEKQWDYLQAFYFIFISISTIGFGDVLPEHPHYFLASSVYILFGLSLVAMVVNVIMEAVSKTISGAKTRLEKFEEKVSNVVIGSYDIVAGSRASSKVSLGNVGKYTHKGSKETVVQLER